MNKTTIDIIGLYLYGDIHSQKSIGLKKSEKNNWSPQKFKEDDEIKRPWNIQLSSATSGDGIIDGFAWIEVQSIAKTSGCLIM